ncbi:MAG: ABC transporter ATP-binding protein [Polyangiaceae bacterium]
MPLREVYRSFVALSSRGSVRRGVLVALVGLVERLLAPVMAWLLFRQSLRDKIVVALILAAAFLLRTFTQRAAWARTEADLFDRVIRALLGGQVLRESVLPDQDASVELGQGVYHAAIAVSQELPNLVADVVACGLLSLVVLAEEPPRLVVAAIGLMLVSALALFWSRDRVQRALSRAWISQGRVLEAFVDALDGRLELVASGLRGRFVDESQARTRAWGAAGVKVAIATALSGRLPLLAMAGGVGFVMAAGSSWRGWLPGGLVDVALFASVTPAFAGVAQGMHAMTRSEPWVRVVARVLQEQIPAVKHARSAPLLPAMVAFDDVSFRYEVADAPDALQEVTFGWSGGSLALGGGNGSGKSTCLRLLLALASPLGGAITVGRVRLEDIDLEDWRGQIAFLPQRPYFPPRVDVRRAIRFLAPDASEERMKSALERVGLHGASLDSTVETLSVGQRQRVALARVLCRDASLYVLDEPDANLDRAGILLVASLVRELATTKMVVLAAHTPELLDAADRIVILERGRVVRDEVRPELRGIGRGGGVPLPLGP